MRLSLVESAGRDLMREVMRDDLARPPRLSNVQVQPCNGTRPSEGGSRPSNATTPSIPGRTRAPKPSARNLWMINEGQRHIFFVVFLFLHALAATLGFLHYFFKDNLVGARAEYGITFVIARAALVLHADVIFILLPVCRNFISVMRRTPVGMATAWAIFIGSWVHTIAHIFNLYHLTMNDTSATTTGQRVVFFIVANFIIGPLITGWIMLIILCIMVYYAIEKRRRMKNGGFEKFWYSHHLFNPFFILWQFHGMF
ncbi:NAD(P)H oxidase isoform 2 [Mycena chlorophos]|uniref:NAD(P)H oxidase isoform 2 n=1 Tax=Mycena chlorophos TaxID=658473 RepID=A0A8H6TAH4_MYCCL|nr:NAD(P)H oxidase isoform 2 [Mycena chlorophos]